MDFGNMSLSNELQSTNLQLEDATLMELEELLYDRIHIEFSGAQILFCHSGTSSFLNSFFQILIHLSQILFILL